MCFVVPGKIDLFQFSSLAAWIMPIVNAFGERIKEVGPVSGFSFGVGRAGRNGPTRSPLTRRIKIVLVPEKRGWGDGVLERPPFNLNY